MASLSNINGLFDVHSTGAILFSTSHGTSGQILQSSGNAAPIWVAASTVIGGPYLPLTGGTLSGPLSGTSANFSGIVYSSGGFRTGSTNSSYNLLTRDNNNGSYPLYCQNSLGVSGDAAIARFAYGSYGANTGTVILDIRSGTSYFNDCNVGIGTASPDTRLTVEGTSGHISANIRCEDGYNASIGFSDASGNWYESYIRYHTDVNDMSFAVNGSERMRIDSSGDVFIKTGYLSLDSKANNSASVAGEYRLALGHDASTDASWIQSNGASGTQRKLLLNPLGGNVGIGETAPAHKLSIKATDDTRGILVNNTLTTSYAEVALKASREFRIGTGGSASATDARDRWYVYDATASAHRLTLDSSGNFGIGTTSPNNFTNQKSLTINGIPGGNSRLDFQINGTNEAEIVANDASLIIAHNDILKFYTAATQRMNILANGNVIIGTETSTACTLKVSSTKNGSSSSPHFCLTGNGYTALHWLDTTAYNIVTTSTSREIRVIAQNGGVKLAYAATAWAANSDIALKENIKPLENVLDKIKDYRCVEYNLKESPEDKKIGFIAQDWVDDFPAIVNKDEKDMLGMKYTETIPVLLKAIQELTAKVKELENK